MPAAPLCPLRPAQAQADQLREQLRSLEARLVAAAEATAAQERRARTAEDGAAEARRQLSEGGMSSCCCGAPCAALPDGLAKLT